MGCIWTLQTRQGHDFRSAVIITAIAGVSLHLADFLITSVIRWLFACVPPALQRCARHLPRPSSYTSNLDHPRCGDVCAPLAHGQNDFALVGDHRALEDSLYNTLRVGSSRFRTVKSIFVAVPPLAALMCSFSFCSAVKSGTMKNASAPCQ